jgi:hypothetical protein
MTETPKVRCPVCGLRVRVEGAGKHARIGRHEAPGKPSAWCDGWGRSPEKS